jgi:hypothetical protein
MMKPPRKILPWLVGLAFGVLIAVLFAPETGWLVRSQLKMQIGGPETMSNMMADLGVRDAPVQIRPDLLQARREALAARYPDDFQIQLAAAASVPTPPRETDPAPSISDSEAPDTSTQRDVRVRALAAKFPNNPSLYAILIRYQTMSFIRLNRPEGDNLNSVSPQKSPDPTKVSTPEHLATYDQDCATGERLDPNNAYFPCMRALGHFAAHRDDEALADLHRAAIKSQWNEYVPDEPRGNFKIAELMTGDKSALTRMAVAAAVLFPHYAQIRAVSRLTAFKAAELEKTGHTEEGLAIRKDMMRIAAKMRVETSTAIGTLVANAVTRISASRPGGAPIKKLTGNNQAFVRLKEYTDYLHRIGQDDEAHWFTEELKYGDAAKAIVSRGLQESIYGDKSIKRLVLYWFADLISLGNAIWLLILAGVSALYLRRRTAREAAGMPADDNFVLFVGAGSILVLLGIIASKQAESGIAYASILAVYGNLTGNGSVSFPDVSPVIIKGFMVACMLLVPVLIVVGSVITGAVKRIPLRLAVARGFRSAGTVLGCLMVVVYAGLAIQTSRVEAPMSQALDSSLQHEGRFLSQLVGANWPGFVDEKAAPK